MKGHKMPYCDWYIDGDCLYCGDCEYKDGISCTVGWFDEKWKKLTCEVCGGKLADDPCGTGRYCPSCRGRALADESLNKVRKQLEADSS